ncbi:MAG: FAD-dependent oxidoreductase [Adlercreutzia mucosicola]|uniref:FAD-dependent oxidoreductase n=1 Tax=Adlercreutzia mucosicola TaxID=580026 RepID=A0A6N8JPY7_9ACTN|nr:FAD-dependent oxidoreductase [Adlercreutzia mucosicola]MVX61878.1 FAD-dependent oxidoreductase [Adlercreutzia mucosicola]
MDEEVFDAIIVGGGLAGCTAAYVLAKAGCEVVVIERGPFSGSKNMTGGRLYGHSLEKVIPGFAETAPVERVITKERLSFLTETEGTTVDYTNPALSDPTCASYAVLRAPFDQWLAEQAEGEGAMFVNEIRVDDLIVEDGRVRGVRAGDDDMYAHVTILADGAVSLLGQKLGMVPKLDPHKYAVAAKETIQLDEKTVSDRFGVVPGEGCAWLFVGDPTHGHIGGGFLYTNKDSVSLGVVTTIGDIDYSDISVPAMLKRLEAHPVVAPLIAGGDMREYTGRMVIEGGLAGVPELVRDGVLIAGDAGALGLNTGYCVRGMDFAIESGRLAAETVLAAKEKDDYSAASLATYTAKLDDSFIMKDLKHYAKFPAFMEETRRMFTDYGPMLNEIMGGLFTVDGSAPVPLTKKAMGAVKKVGLMNIAKDARKGMKAL